MEELEREAGRLADAGGRLVAINDRLAARVEQLEAAIIAHIEARDAYFHQWARKSGWHDGNPVDDGSAARETWRALREVVGR